MVQLLMLKFCKDIFGEVDEADGETKKADSPLGQSCKKTRSRLTQAWSMHGQGLG